jgi:hypothetical protein
MSYQDDINWLWGNHDAPQQLKCTGFMVDGDTFPKPRGFATGQQCLINCIHAKRDGNDSLALNWLRAGQCHNPAVQNEFSQNAAAAVKYAVDTYGSQVP